MQNKPETRGVRVWNKVSLRAGGGMQNKKEVDR
jgi:hypothetical protein